MAIRAPCSLTPIFHARGLPEQKSSRRYTLDLGQRHTQLSKSSCSNVFFACPVHLYKPPKTVFEVVFYCGYVGKHE